MPKRSEEANMRFIYDEPALILSVSGKEWLVVGDIHIGAERRLSDKGVNVYNMWKQMASKILSLSNTFSITGVILLGDIKDSILYPETWEQRDIRSFISELSHLELRIIKGNHDGHIDSILGIKAMDEILLGDYALLHGNKWPSQDALKKGTIITGHNHIAVSIKDDNGAVYSEKAWLIASAEKDKIREFYASPKAKRLVVMPAFNPLILGMPVGKERKDKDNISPLLRNGLFDYSNADIYSLKGAYIGKVKALSSERGNNANKPKTKTNKK